METTIEKQNDAEIRITKQTEEVEVISLGELRTQEANIIANIEYHNQALADVRSKINEALKLGILESTDSSELSGTAEL